jgi:Ca-activated chloride channel family protein
MRDLVLQNVDMLQLFWLLPVLLSFLLWAAQARKKALAGFVAAPLLPGMLIPADPFRRTVKLVCFLAALAAIFFSLCRPAWNKKEIPVKQSGRDVVFMLDVSRSMLAEDLVPNRLERAKLAIADAIEVLQGDRVALVPFAGTARVSCPLTTDYAFFRMSLESTDTESVSRGSTMIGDAVRFVIEEVFDDQTSQYTDIVLITDGEDHESFPVEAARAAGERGARMIIVGLGDEAEGSRIPITDPEGRRTFLKYQGREIWTKLDAETLRRMAGVTPGGFYLPVSTGNIDLGKVYRELISTGQRREFAEKNMQGYEEKFQIFLGLALALLAMEAAIAEGRRNENGTYFIG